MPVTQYGSSSSDSTLADEEENAPLIEECKSNPATERNVEENYESYDCETPFQRRWFSTRGRLQSAWDQLGIPRQILNLQDARSFITGPKVQHFVISLTDPSRIERYKQWLNTFLIFLIPSFIHHSSRTFMPKKLNKMAYLDGLRGVAALFVAIHHYTCQFTPALLEGWGAGATAAERNQNRWLLQLPLIRVVHSGSFMVVLFFVISGCVLSARGLKLARARKQSVFAQSLTSSVFRRWLRLHLPVIASMCIAFVLSRNEMWTHLQPDWLAPYGAPPLQTTLTPLMTNQTNMTILTPTPITADLSIVEEETIPVKERNKTQFGEIHARNVALLSLVKNRIQWDWTGAKKNESLTWQMGDFFWGVVDVCDPFRGGGIPTIQSAGYNSGMILWTIPSEWLGSLVVFIVVLGVAWTRTWMKLSLLFGMVFWCHYCAKWQLATFLSGTFIAELTIIHGENTENDLFLSLPIEDQKDLSVSSNFFETYNEELILGGWISLFVVGMYIGCLPMINWDISPGFIMLRAMIPKWYLAKDLFYPCIGAVFVMLSITYCPTIQRLFLTRFAQYLGRISFSLYLLHTQILTSLGIRVFTGAMKFVGGGEDQIGFVVGIILGSAIMAPVTLWAADVFCRGVDERCVYFARWVAKQSLLLEQ